MTEARRLLKLTQAILHGYACQQEDDCLEACEMARAYLAMTTCEETGQPTLNGVPISQMMYRWLTAVYVRKVWDDRMQTSRSREGELVAALQKYSTHSSGCLAEGWKRGNNEYRCDCGLDVALARAALAQGKKE